ncbi:hypothetical protein CLAIMM_10097 [Cladophialophora immunda]|nr:hypothetical protein CLAIMM_10097 [Cladophialophora immunda]
MPKPSKSSTPAPSLQDGTIVVTSQQSRFHVDALDAPTSKDIDVKDLTLTVGGRELLDHAHLRIVEGVHYVLAGRNGTGKSSLLRALAERRVPGVPRNLRLLLLGQMRVSSDAVTESDGSESESDTTTVLEHVTRSDRRREQALKDANRLAAALEDKAHSSKIVTTVRSLQLEQAKQELAEARLVAARRSGARGLKARQMLIEREKEVEEAQKR